MNGISSSKALESGDFFTSSTSQKKLKSLERHRRHQHQQRRQQLVRSNNFLNIVSAVYSEREDNKSNTNNNDNNNNNNNNNNVRQAKVLKVKRSSALDLKKKRDSVFGVSTNKTRATRTITIKKVEGLDEDAEIEREKLWKRAQTKTKRSQNVEEEKYGYLFGIVGKDRRVSAGGGREDSTETKRQTRSRGSSREDVHGAYKTHKDRFMRAITAEFEDEARLFKERLEAWPLSRLKNEGYCLSDMRARYEGTIGRDALVRVVRPRKDLPKNTPLGEELPFHRITVGDMVVLSDNETEKIILDIDPNGGGNENSVVGIVASRQMFFLTIAIPEDDLGDILRDGENGRRLRIDLSANTVAYDRACAALENFSQPGGMPSIVSTTSKSTNKEEKISTTAYQPFQRGLLGYTPRTSLSSVNGIASTPVSWKNEQKIEAATKEYTKNLNSSQRKAVKAAMGNTLTLWRGPPGTGKTRTLVSLIASAVNYANVQEKNTWRGPKVLATAASNVAVDNILDALRNENMHVSMNILRLGSPARVQPWLLESTLSAKVALSAKGKQANAIREKLRGISSMEAAKARKQATQLDREAAIQIINTSDVILATCVGAGDELLEGTIFRHCVVDEAAQCVEPATLIPITKALSGVLVGDSKQLPPTVVSREACTLGLQMSLMERLENLGVTPFLLDEQYRMHPGLAAFSSVRFYDRKLTSVPKPSDRIAPTGVNWPSSMLPLAFIEVSGEEMRAPDGNSIFNTQEAVRCVQIVRKLLESGGVENAGSIGVIAPYAAQVRAITEEWNRCKNVGDNITLKNRNNDTFEDNDPEKMKNELEIRSVDGFQGREKEVIILCTVRNNINKQLGFVSDPRRLNVAITRAKRGLIVLGNRQTLASDKLWEKWLNFVDKYECEVNSERFLK